MSAGEIPLYFDRAGSRAFVPAQFRAWMSARQSLFAGLCAKNGLSGFGARSLCGVAAGEVLFHRHQAQATFLVTPSFAQVTALDVFLGTLELAQELGVGIRVAQAGADVPAVHRGAALEAAPSVGDLLEIRVGFDVCCCFRVVLAPEGKRRSNHFLALKTIQHSPPQSALALQQRRVPNHEKSDFRARQRHAYTIGNL